MDIPFTYPPDKSKAEFEMAWDTGDGKDRCVEVTYRKNMDGNIEILRVRVQHNDQ